jgi:hypothetical protein
MHQKGHMEYFEYYTALRSEILEIISGVENASHSFAWDNTTPNWVSKGTLEKLFSKYLNAARNFGLYVVTRHTECQNLNHGFYPTSNNYGFSIPYRSDEYVWGGGQMYQGSRLCTCPCSNENIQTAHSVIDDVVYDKKADLRQCENLEDILSDINKAITRSGNNLTRSAIREYLLLAIIKINH